MPDPLDDIRKKKLEALMRAQQQKQQEAQEFDQQVAQLEAIVKRHMTKEALWRYGNVKLASPDKATQVLVILAQFVQSGRLDTIDDELLKKVLMRMQEGTKKNFNIKK